MGKPSFCLRNLICLFLLLLMSGCEVESPIPTDVIVEGRITTDGGTTPMANMRVVLYKSIPLSLDVNELYAKTDANGYFRFKFKANHKLNERTYGLGYDISDVDDEHYFCPSNYLSIGHLPSADTTLVYNFQLPRKVEIQCVYKDPTKARELELNTIFRFTCGLDSDSTQFMNETGAVSMDYTENPLYIPFNTPVIVVTRGIDRKLSKPLEKQDTIRVSQASGFVYQINF